MLESEPNMILLHLYSQCSYFEICESSARVTFAYHRDFPLAQLQEEPNSVSIIIKACFSSAASCRP